MLVLGISSSLFNFIFTIFGEAYRARGVRGSAPGDTQPSLGWDPTLLPGSPIRVIERKTQGVGATECSTNFLGKVLHIEL